MDNTNLWKPHLGQSWPIYPHLMQSVRVTAATVPGPSGGYTSSSMLAALLYIGYVEQLQPNNILPRDREPCLVNDLNGLGLAPGYYDGRLAGSFNGLPVYNVGGAGGASNVTLPGLTQTQIANLTTNLSPGQVNILNNLNACQLQSLLGGTNTSQLQILTGSLTPTQLSNLVGNLTSSQITTLLGNLSVSQIQTLTTALSPSQIFNLVSTLTSQQLSILTVGISPSNVNSLVSQLSQQQLITWLQLVSSRLLTTTQALSLFTGLTQTQFFQLLSFTPTQIANMVKTMTQTAISTALDAANGVGYVPNATTVPSIAPANGSYLFSNPSTGDLSVMGPNGTIVDLTAGGSGGGAVNALTSGSGTTTTAYVTIINVTNSKGLHGSFAIKNTSTLNKMNVQVFTTDMFGNVSSGSVAILFGNTYEASAIESLSTSGSYPPFSNLTIQVEDYTSGSHANYQWYLSLVG